MRRLPLRALLATAALAACALGWAASADASPAVRAKAERLQVAALVESRPQAVADQSATREADPVRTSDGSRADSRPNGNANAAFLAAFVLAGVTAVLVVAASRVSSG
jgi:hypothetical protein